MPKVPLGLRLEQELIDAVDAARGDVPRAKWIERALAAALGAGERSEPDRMSAVARPGSASPRTSTLTPDRVAEFMRGPR